MPVGTRRQPGLRRAFLGIGSICAVGLLWLAIVVVAQACAIDGIASLQVNNQYVLKNSAVATAKTVQTWTPFVASTVYGTNSPISFTENKSRVLLSLSSDSVTTPYIWKFGDGRQAQGFTVQHRYAKTGTYRVEAWYYAPLGKTWVRFDMTQVHVVPPNAVPAVSSGSSPTSPQSIMRDVAGLGLLIVLGSAGVSFMRRRSPGRLTPAQSDH